MVPFDCQGDAGFSPGSTAAGPSIQGSPTQLVNRLGQGDEQGRRYGVDIPAFDISGSTPMTRPRPLFARLLALLLLIAVPLASRAAPPADAQREPELKSAVQHAIDQAECFEDKFDSAVWYKMMEPRLRKRVPDREERMAILKNVFCEATRRGEARIPPGLVMAIIEIESNFDRWAVSYAGAVGLMQVMPFWTKVIGDSNRRALFDMQTNLRYGCSILRMYIDMEGGNLYLALGRYNGSLGQAQYPNLVLAAWRGRWKWRSRSGPT